LLGVLWYLLTAGGASQLPDWFIGPISQQIRDNVEGVL
jgi:hypothetical protein